MYKAFFKKMLGDEQTSSVYSLKELVEVIRTQKSKNNEYGPSIEGLIRYFEEHPGDAQSFFDYLIHFIKKYKKVDVFTHTGLLSGRGFLTLLKERIGERLIPSIKDKEQLSYVLTSIFDSKEDVEWLDSITATQWHKLFGVLMPIDNLESSSLATLNNIQADILHAVNLLSYEISGLSLHEEVIKAYPEIMELNSPFIAQNQEIVDYVKNYERFLADDISTSTHVPEEDHILVMLDQCLMLLKTTHKNTYVTGVSIRLTNVLARLEQKVVRLEQLLFLLHPDGEKRSKAFGELIYSITHGHHNSSKVQSLIRSNTQLLSLRIIESASRVGETYVSKDMKSHWKMFKVSAGAGLLIGLMATIKILLGKFLLPPIGRAIVNSMNYSFGFVLIYVCHFKIATKQPAMTASALASSIGQANRYKRSRLIGLSKLIVDILRTQVAAIVGNITMAMPVAFICCYVWNKYVNTALLSQEKAQNLLIGIDPINSLALFYAALTGVFLFFSGIIAGYYDNMAIYRNLGPRISRHALVTGLFGKSYAKKIGTYIEKKFGSIAGNFWFGVMLGSTSTLGYILGLPLDIRHIAFSSANFVQGIFWMNSSMNIVYIIYLFIGVLLIGFINLFVSFSLTLMVALRARKIKFSQWKDLFFLVMLRIYINPLILFLPESKDKPKILNEPTE